MKCCNKEMTLKESIERIYYRGTENIYTCEICNNEKYEFIRDEENLRVREIQSRVGVVFDKCSFCDNEDQGDTLICESCMSFRHNLMQNRAGVTTDILMKMIISGETFTRGDIISLFERRKQPLFKTIYSEDDDNLIIGQYRLDENGYYQADMLTDDQIKNLKEYRESIKK